MKTHENDVKGEDNILEQDVIDTNNSDENDFTKNGERNIFWIIFCYVLILFAVIQTSQCIEDFDLNNFDQKTIFSAINLLFFLVSVILFVRRYIVGWYMLTIFWTIASFFVITHISNFATFIPNFNKIFDFFVTHFGFSPDYPYIVLILVALAGLGCLCSSYIREREFGINKKDMYIALSTGLGLFLLIIIRNILF